MNIEKKKGPIYVDDSDTLRSLDLEILALFLTIVPIPLLIIAFIAGIATAVGYEAWTTFFIYLGISILSWMAAPGIWKLRRSAFFIVLAGFVSAIVASSLGFFAEITTGIWDPGEKAIYVMGIIELIVYSAGILILIRNWKKFFTKKIDTPY
ncbi:MAG: hypothetical protein ACTSRZ_03765 [Promethearchaeota archaeon]